MGIQGLQSEFRSNGLVSNIRVERMIQKFRSERGPECIPKILIDCRQRTWIFKKDDLFDCSWRILHQRAQDLVSFFERLDCEVIGFKGESGNDDRTFFNMKLLHMQEYLDLFYSGRSSYKKHLPSYTLNSTLFCYPLFSSLVFHSMCEMRISLYASDSLMMAYAKKNDACAIITDNTDCLAYDCNICVILSSMLDVWRGESEVYGSKRDYCNRIGINPDHFPIFCAAIKSMGPFPFPSLPKELPMKRYSIVTQALFKKRALSVEELLQEENMSELSTEVRLTNEESENVDLADNASKFRALRKRMYSYAFQELRGKCQSIVEYYPCGGPAYRNISVDILEPAVPSPGLLQLWDREREDLTDMRWKIFGSIISSRLDIDSLRRLPEDLVLPVSIAFYMKHESGDTSIEDWELEALVFHPQLAPQLRLAPRKYGANVRVMELFSTFLDAYLSVMLSVIASGFPVELKKVVPWDYHGIVFQQVYMHLSIHRQATVQFTRTDTYLRAKNILKMA